MVDLLEDVDGDLDEIEAIVAMRERDQKNSYKKNCHGCGRFVEKSIWVPKSEASFPLCWDCRQNYDSPYDM